MFKASIWICSRHKAVLLYEALNEKSGFVVYLDESEGFRIQTQNTHKSQYRQSKKIIRVFDMVVCLYG